MATALGPDIITDSLVLSIDPASKRCNASSGGTLLTNLALSGTSSSVVNGTTSESKVVLDGTNDYITVNNSVTSPTLSPAVATFSIWFNPDVGSYSNGNHCSLISRGNYNTSGGFFIHMRKNSNVCQVNATFSYSTTNSYTFEGTSYQTVNPFGEWSNITVTVDSTIKLYFNGVLEQTASRSCPDIKYGNGNINTNSDTDLRWVSSLGYAPTLEQGAGGHWRPYNGDFGLGLMYSRILTAAEVLQNYNAQKSRFI
tara:strand:+ start:74 stop:838 length:765 start_codon:yes stop_codon:yes gene_type:complete